MPITHLRTIYKGCPAADNGIARPHASHIVRLCRHTIYSHATLMSQLGRAFLHAQQNYDDKISWEPQRICVLIAVWPDEKRKEENAESVFDTLVYFIENMKNPTNGAIVSIYYCDNMFGDISEEWVHGNFWPFQKQWDPQNQYITIHKCEPFMSKRRKDKTLTHEETVLPIIENLAHDYGLSIKPIDYTMTAKEIVETMTYSNYHFSYQGGTWFMASMIGIPSLAWHDQDIVYEAEVNWHDVNYNKIKEKIQFNSWGLMTSGPGWIKQYCFDNKRVISRPNRNQKFISDIPDVYEAFEGMIK